MRGSAVVGTDAKSGVTLSHNFPRFVRVLLAHPRDLVRGRRGGARSHGRDIRCRR